MYECEVVVDQALEHRHRTYGFCREHLLLGEVGERVSSVCGRRKMRLIHSWTVRGVVFALETLSMFVWRTSALAWSFKGARDLKTLASLARLLFVTFHFSDRA